MNLQATTMAEQVLQTASLTTYFRASGEMYYCFSELKARFFSAVPPGTLKTWTRNLNITKEKCTFEEHEYFRVALPKIAIGAFKLISHKNTLKLLEHCYNKVRDILGPFCREPCFKTSNTSVTASSPAFQNSPLHISGITNTCNISAFASNVQGNQKRNVCVTTQASPLQKEDDIQISGNLRSCFNSELQNTSKSDSNISTQTVPSIYCPASFCSSIVEGPIYSQPTTNQSTKCISLSEKCKDVSSTGTKPVSQTIDAKPSTESIDDDMALMNSNVADQKSIDNVSEPLKVIISDDELNGGPSKKFKIEGRISRALPLSELSSDTAVSVKKLISFYSKPLNPKRIGHALKPSSVDKIVERIRVFFKFLKDSKGLCPTLDHVENSNLVEEFCNYLRSKERNLKSSTISRHISAFINVVRFINEDIPLTSQENLVSLSRLRALQSQLEYDARREKRANDDKASNNAVLYEEILQVVRNLKHKFEDASSIYTKARCLMNFCILLLYTLASPGRAKEFVTLRITDSDKNANTQPGNFLIVKSSAITLVCKDYKTSTTYGTDRTELTSSDLVHYIRLFIEKYRFRILQGNTHDFLFSNYHGLPFTVPGFNKYLGSLFEEECNVRLSVNDLRKTLVTYFMSLPEASDEQLSESVARLMRHSRKTQKRYYDSRSQDLVKRPALGFLAKTATASIFHEDLPFSSSTSDCRGGEDVRPIPGDFVALVASNSTTASPQIMIAKLLRYTQDGNEALLASMSEVHENTFVLDTGESFLEEANSLIFPVDLVYLPSDRLYQLRSSKLEIHQQTHH